MASWTEIKSSEAFDKAMSMAKGDYQRALLHGVESLSGSTLKGKASRYGGRYAASRRALLGRMTAAGIPWSERRGEHGKRILVIGS